jgi:hypothetical protein
LIGVLGFGLTLILEKKNNQEVKKMQKKIKVGVPHPEDTF